MKNIGIFVKFVGILQKCVKDESVGERFVCTFCGCEFTPKSTALALSMPFRDDIYLKCPECACRRPCRIKRD